MLNTNEIRKQLKKEIENCEMLKSLQSVEARNFQKNCLLDTVIFRNSKPKTLAEILDAADKAEADLNNGIDELLSEINYDVWELLKDEIAEGKL